MHHVREPTADKLRLNAIRFVEESIRYARKSKRLDEYWPFAILNLVQALELLLKSLLLSEHPILIYENVDNKKRTVNLHQALDRLVSLNRITFDPEEIKIIQRASKQRNKFLHLEHDSEPEYLQAIYINLFEFLHFFYHAHFKEELHEQILESLWRAEADLIAEFEKQWVTYRGREVLNAGPLNILLGQKYNAVKLSRNGESDFYERHRLEKDTNYPEMEWCDDCSANIGEYHGAYCDIERCPVCGNQLLMCLWMSDGCGVEYWIQRDSSLLKNA